MRGSQSGLYISTGRQGNEFALAVIAGPDAAKAVTLGADVVAICAAALVALGDTLGTGVRALYCNGSDGTGAGWHPLDPRGDSARIPRQFKSLRRICRTLFVNADKVIHPSTVIS